MSKIQPNPTLTLASTSPFRKKLLERLGIDFGVVAPGVDETAHPDEAGQGLERRLSTEKASAVAETLPTGLVIGSDQVAVLGDEILGKPRDRADAIRQLTLSSGRELSLYTGLALINAATGALQQDVISYRVRYRELSLAQIEQYLDLDEPYGCCGTDRPASHLSCGDAQCRRY